MRSAPVYSRTHERVVAEQATQKGWYKQLYRVMVVSSERTPHVTSANFWPDSQLAAIHTMLHPRSIAVIGATARLQYGGRLLNAVLRSRDRLRGYPVNPKHDVLGRVKR